MRRDGPHRQTDEPSGFTLVEILVAMLILAIGIMAALSMQFAALGGAVASRDLTNASDVAQRVKNIMDVEAQQWRSGDISTSVKAAYDWEAGSLLKKAADTGWDWAPVFDEPVDTRMTSSGNERYCVYVRGDYLAGSGQLEQRMFRAQIAVVYPSGNQSYRGSCEDPDGQGDLVANLEPDIEAEETGSVDLRGFRAVYLGSVISSRAHLY